MVVIIWKKLNPIMMIKYYINKFEKRKDGSLLAKIAVDNNVYFYFEHVSIRLDTNTI